MKNTTRYLTVLSLIFAVFISSGCGTAKKIAFRSDKETPDNKMQFDEVLLGIDVLVNFRLDAVERKRVGLITNPSGVNRYLESTIDILHRHPEINLTTLFSPEHGIRGDKDAGEQVDTNVDPETGLPVYSLYGKTKKPTPEMLSNVDILLFDIQDVGVRPYTYIYTMAYAMEAAKEAGIPFCVLDRPNPMGGIMVEGSVLDPAFKSFIGLYPIPYVHGMTAGELAWLFNREFGIETELLVVPVEGWSRGMTWMQTGLHWVPTSPHIPEPSTVPYFAATGCVGELGTIHTGVGYTMPFKLLGGPWINAADFAREMNGRDLPGVTFRPMYWTPYYGLWRGEQVGGVQLHITDFNRFEPFATGIQMLSAIRMLYPGQDIFPEGKTSGFNRASGTDTILRQLRAGVPADVIVDSYRQGLEEFKKLREKYLLYH